MIREFEVAKKSETPEYIIIGGVPVFCNGNYIIVHPRLNNLVIEIENNIDYVLLKKHKKLFVLDNHFYNDRFEPKLYYKYIDMIDIKSVKKIFKNDSKKLEFSNFTTFTTKEKLLSSPIIKTLKNYYDINLIKKIIDEILVKSTEEFNSHDSYEDYDYNECVMIAQDKLLNDYYKDISDNLEVIYIIQSMIYYDFYELYYELYCYTKTHLLK